MVYYGVCRVAGDGLCHTGCEASLWGDPANCGACGAACPSPDPALHVASVACNGGTCGVGACVDGCAHYITISAERYFIVRCSYMDADGDLDNGCEAISPGCYGASCTATSECEVCYVLWRI
jgi:hypothetical protein